MRKLLFTSAIIHLTSSITFSQTCPTITAGNNATICSGCTTLTAAATPTAQTTSYVSGSIPYTPQTYTGTQVLAGVDDEWSAVIPLGFTFCFYGIPYTDCVIGSNGCISFDLSNAFGYNTWPISAAFPTNFDADMMNTINSPWHDIDPSIGGAIYYQTLGTAPCRMFVVSYSQVPMFLCNNLIAHHQMVLYETTNIIDIFIGNKPICTTWNGGTAIEGVQNNTGTIATVTPGRNYPTQWTASNDGQRFSPAGTPTYVVSWYNSSNVLQGTGASISLCPTTTTTYYAQVIYTNCDNSTVSMNSNNVTITVGGGPTVTSTSTPASCTNCNGTATATAVGGNPPFTYSWTTVPSQNTVIATGLCAGTYTCFVTDASGCTVQTTIVVTNTGGMTSTQSQINIPCFGQCNGTGTINPSGGTPPYSYSWNTVPPQLTQTATGLCAGTYTAYCTDANGCTTSQVITITQPPALTVVTNNPPAVCSGACATITATTNGGTPGYTYLWTPGNMITSSASVCPTVTTTYTITNTDANGCTATGTVTVTVNPLPTVTATASPTAYCAGGSSNLTATGGTSYVWTPVTGLSNTTISNPVANPTVTTTYTVTVTDANGCTNTASVTVTVNALPNITITATPPTICASGSSNLNASGAVSYVWTPSTGLSSSIISNPVATPSTTITYTVTGTGANGCTNTATITIVVSSNPIATASASPTSVCLGQSSTLTAGGGTTYAWSPSTGLSATTGSVVTATPTTSTTYTVTVTNAAGCTATATVNVTITAGPSVAAGTSTNQICGNTDGTATAGVVTGTGPFTYLWSPGGQTNATATGLTAGTYTVLITDAAGCIVTQTVTVNVILGVIASATANPTTGVWPLNVTFTNTSTGANNYSWTFGDATNSTLQDPVHTYGAPGTYTVMLVAWNNNPLCADTFYLTIIVYDEVILIIPNIFTPNGDGKNDVFSATVQGIADITGTIYDRWGVEVGVWSGGATGGWNGITTKGKKVSDGTYYYVLTATGFDGKVYEEKGFVQVLQGN